MGSTNVQKGVFRLNIYDRINDERTRQDKKWGDQSGNPHFLWNAVLVEEVGEVANAILEGMHVADGGIESLEEELIQVAAVTVAWLEKIQADRPISPEEIKKRIQEQDDLCVTKKMPRFAPPNGICSGCRRQIYDKVDGKTHVTGCPHCNKSYCE